MDFKALPIPNRQSKGADILRECSPPHHVSQVFCRMSGVWCQVSHVTWLTFFGQSGGAILLKVCNQQSLPRLVY